jgi:glycosyltransferase involved in cell wall biosynthesis
MQTKHEKFPLMLSTYARGGIRSVVEAYEKDGLLADWRFQLLWTHTEGGKKEKIMTCVKAYFKLLSLLILNKISFIHLHAAMRGSFWRKTFFMLTARLFNVPCILHLHGSEMKVFYDHLPTIGKKAVSWSLTRAQKVIVLSDSWHAFISKIAPKANISIVNNYVSLPKLTSSHGDLHRFNVLFLGILGQRKGIYDLLKIWPEVLKEVPQAVLLVGGNGEVEQAKLMAQQLNIQHAVRFLGWIDQTQKNQLLEEADVFDLPSYNEGLPMSVLEAMSWGKSVITTRVGGIPQLITDHENGFLITPGEQTRHLELLIMLAKDSATRQKVGQSARIRIENAFSDQVILPKLAQIYQELS